MRKIAKVRRGSQTSFIMTIPKEIIDEFKLRKDDFIEVAFMKKIEIDNIKSYRCKACSYRFDTDDEILYCPSCNCVDLEEEKYICNNDECKKEIIWGGNKDE